MLCRDALLAHRHQPRGALAATEARSSYNIAVEDCCIRAAAAAGAEFVVGRGHASLLSNSDTHSIIWRVPVAGRKGDDRARALPAAANGECREGVTRATRVHGSDLIHRARVASAVIDPYSVVPRILRYTQHLGSAKDCNDTVC